MWKGIPFIADRLASRMCRWLGEIRPRLGSALALTACVLITMPVYAIRICDITRIKGMEQNELVGMGLVTGLNGTGDSAKKSFVGIRSLAEVYRKHGFLVESIDELMNVDSIALVTIRVTVPATGIREGDLLDAEISSVGDATDLAGGSLLWTILRAPPFTEPFARASGPIHVSLENPRKGIITDGAQMLQDIRVNVLNPGQNTVTLVIDDEYAGYPAADAIANRITQEFALDLDTPGIVWATVEDPKNVTIHFASNSQIDPSSLLAQIQTINMDSNLLQTQARVIINREEKIFLVSANVEISPFVMSTRGLSITRIDPPPVPTQQDPVFSTERHVAIASQRNTSAAAKARLQDLIEAFDAMEVPFEDRVAILIEMKNLGVLHAELIPK